jgi:hypothetical protein
MNITHTTLKKPGGIELIWTVGSLHIAPFLLHTSPFQLVVQGGIVYRKKPLVGKCLFGGEKYDGGELVL